MIFDIYGPFEIPRMKPWRISNRKEGRIKIRGFWEAREQEEEGLSLACGCYVFYIGAYPWYIGMAEHGFRQECFTDNKVNIYNEALSQKQGIPQLILITKCTPTYRFTGHGDNQRDIQKLEDMLIGLGIARNPELLNIRGTKLLKEMNVPGIINTKKGQGKAAPVQELRRILGL